MWQISWVVVVILQVIAMIWPRTGIYAYILAHIIDLDMIYRIITLLLSWSRIVAVTAALVSTVRYIRRNK